jgi:hypothetical protein
MQCGDYFADVGASGDPNTKKSRQNKHKKHATNHSDRTSASHYTVYDTRVTLVTGWRNEKAPPPPPTRTHIAARSKYQVKSYITSSTSHSKQLFACWLFTILASSPFIIQRGMSRTPNLGVRYTDSFYDTQPRSVHYNTPRSEWI